MAEKPENRKKGRKKSRKTHRKTHQKTRGGSVGEWVGARFALPSPVVGEGPEYYPVINLWIEQPEGLVLAIEIVRPDECGGSLSDALVTAMGAPLVGAPRRPLRLRVADQGLAAEVRDALSEAAVNIPVIVAPTPEAQEVLDAMNSLPGSPTGPESYLEGDGVTEAGTRLLFEAASRLYSCAPWEWVDDSLIRLDIAALGVRSACISIIGQLEESSGFIVFPSLDEYEEFMHLGPDASPTFSALSYERSSSLPPKMVGEAEFHGWRVPDLGVYPLPMSMVDGQRVPVSGAEVRVLASCATSLVAFCTQFRNELAQRDFAPTCASFEDDDVTVRLTTPYVADGRVETAEPAPPVVRRVAPRVGRNDPCPCGSGKKYKKCHLDADAQRAAPAAASPASSVHELDERLAPTIARWAARTFGKEWMEAKTPFSDPDVAWELFGPWSVYIQILRERRVFEHFLEARGDYLSAEERDWLGAQQRAWLSIWEVESVDPGTGMRVRDLLSGEVRDVVEASASRIMPVRASLLGRVVDHAGVSVLCGLHSSPLPPREAAEVVRRARKRLRRKTAVPVDRLRDSAFAERLIGDWEDVCAEYTERISRAPVMQNTDGDALLLTVDHFEFDSCASGRVEAALAEIEGVVPPREGDARGVYSFARARDATHSMLETTTVAVVRVADGKLTAETNSIERADAIRGSLEDVGGDLLRHRLREHTDPLSTAAVDSRGGGDADAGLDDPELQRLAREFKERHYATWPDVALPALAGQTPRQAMRTAAGREEVLLLLKEHERLESQSPEGTRYDVNILRRALGIER